MKIRKDYLIDRIQYYFLILFPFSIVLFNPSKEFFGFLSITDIFVTISIFLFLLYSGISKIKITTHFILLIVVFVFSFMSLVVNEKYGLFNNIKYQFRWLFYITTFFIVYNYINSKSLFYFKKGIYLSAFFVCIYAILQSLFKELMIPTIFWIHTFPDYINITFRAIGTFDNPLNLCAFLVFPLGIIQYTSNKTKKEKALNILIYATLVFTVSKIAVIIIIVSLLVYFKKYIRFIIYGFLTIVMVLIIYINIPNTAFNQSYIYQRFNNKEVINQSIDTRLYMLQSSLQIIKANPFFGIGYDNFEENYRKLKKSRVNIKLTGSSFTSENFLLDFYLDNGLIPFLIVLFLFFETILLFYYSENEIMIQFTFSIILYVIVGLIMSSRTVPVMYLLFAYLATIFKVQTNEIKTVNNYS